MMLQTTKQWYNSHQNKILALIIGFGLALFGLHWQSQPLIEWFFLPPIGLIISAIGIYKVLNKSKIQFGSRLVWIPLLVIIVSIVLSGLINNVGLSSKLFAVVFAGYLLGVYLVALKLGRDMLFGLMPVSIMVACSIIFEGITIPGIQTGGIMMDDASIGFIILGISCYKFKYQWLVVSFGIIALFLSGVLEAAFTGLVIFIAINIKRNWNKKTLLPIAIFVFMTLLWQLLGYFQPLWLDKVNVQSTASVVTGDAPLTGNSMDKMTTNRWSIITQRMKIITPLGHGFWVTMPDKSLGGRYLDTGEYRYDGINQEPVANVPLVIVDQIGILAALSWTFVSLYCLRKSRWSYAWLAILALCVFDHYIWTQFAPIWWAVAGITLHEKIL